MKYKITAKGSVQLLSIGQVLPSGATYEWEGKELPKELEMAQRQGLIMLDKVEDKTEPMAAPLPPSVNPPEPPKEEKKQEQVKEQKKEEEKPEQENENEEDEEDDDEVDFPKPQKPLDKMSKDELVEYASEIGLDPGTMYKADLLKAIEKWIE